MLRIKPQLIVGQQCRQGLFQAVDAGQRLQLRQPRLATTLTRRGEGIKHLASAEGTLRTVVAQHQAIAMHRLQRRIELQLGKHAPTRQQLLALQQRHSGGDVLGAQMHMYRAEMREVADFAR
ncbi:hypothetical protein D3C77_359820 [compost metagenome]